MGRPTPHTMYKYGHFGAALLAYAPLAFVATAIGDRQLVFLGSAVALGLAMLPDVDQRIPGLPHRGPTHTLTFVVVVGVAVGLAGALVGMAQGILAAVGLAVFGFLVGAGTIGSHLLADMLTPAGVDVRGTGHRRSFHVARAANPIANYLLLGLGGLVALLAIGAGATVARLLGL